MKTAEQIAKAIFAMRGAKLFTEFETVIIPLPSGESISIESWGDIHRNIIDSYQSSSISIGDGQCVVECRATFPNGEFVSTEVFFENGTRCTEEEREDSDIDGEEAIEAFWEDVYSMERLQRAVETLMETGQGCDTFDYEGNRVDFGAEVDSYGRAV